MNDMNNNFPLLTTNELSPYERMLHGLYEMVPKWYRFPR